MNAQDFIRRVAPGAQASMRKKGILSSLTIAQAALESGWGANAPGNNLFGIKANGWSGPTQVLTTVEFIGGRTATVKDLFRVYPSLEDSIADHADFLKTNFRYENLIGVRGYRAACSLIAADGYSTAPDYADSLIGLIGQYALDRYDALPALVCLDAPTEGAACSGKIEVSGWAVGVDGISRVDVYADGSEGLASISAFAPRPDVAKAENPFGFYSGAEESGFCCSVPAGRLAAGRHTLDVAVVERNGRVTWLSRPISVLIPAKICIDFPADNAVLFGDAAVGGWAVAAQGIRRVDVAVDGRIAAGIERLSPRPDVNRIVNPYGRYKDAANSGFSCQLPSGRLTPGRHLITCAATSNDGTVVRAARSVTV